MKALSHFIAWQPSNVAHTDTGQSPGTMPTALKGYRSPQTSQPRFQKRTRSGGIKEPKAVPSLDTRNFRPTQPPMRVARRTRKGK